MGATVRNAGKGSLAAVILLSKKREEVSKIARPRGRKKRLLEKKGGVAPFGGKVSVGYMKGTWDSKANRRKKVNPNFLPKTKKD